MDYRARLDLTGRLALVTGAGQGIGAAVAEALAATGAEVICTDILRDRAEATAGALRAQGYAARAEALDVTDSAAIDALAAALPPLDVLVCNAGIVFNTPAEAMDDAEWDRVIGVNLTGVFRTCRGFGRRMLEAGRGAIINIGSMSAEIVNQPRWQISYLTSKAAVHQLTKGLAAEWAPHGIRVNAMAPGYFLTEMSPVDQPEYKEWCVDPAALKRWGEPEELGPVAIFLASEASSFMTGSIVTVDGGFTLF